MAEEVGSFPKAIPLPKRRVLRFRALLDAKHDPREIILLQSWGVNADDEHIAALGQQLPQLAADRICETLLLGPHIVIG